MDEPPRRGGRVVAAFDFDKTISTRDNVVPFLRAVVGRPRLARALLEVSPRLVRAVQDPGHGPTQAVNREGWEWFGRAPARKR